MNSCAEDFIDILEAESALGLTLGDNLFTGQEPSSPHNTVTIFDTFGSPPQLTFNYGENYFYDSVQIRVRNKKYEDAYTLAHEIREALHGRGQETWNGTLYSAIICTSGPAMLGWDDNGRVWFIINFQCQRR